MIGGVGVGLLLGPGLFCIWWSFWPREDAPVRARRAGLMTRLADQLAQAGLRQR